MKHADLVNSILLTLAPHGLVWSNPTGAVRADDRFIRFGQPGSPDILGCLKGRFVGIECKVGKDRQSTVQKNFEAAISRNGGVYILARSIDDVRNRLTLEGLL